MALLVEEGGVHVPPPPAIGGCTASPFCLVAFLGKAFEVDIPIVCFAGICAELVVPGLPADADHTQPSGFHSKAPSKISA